MITLISNKGPQHRKIMEIVYKVKKHDSESEVQDVNFDWIEPCKSLENLS